MQAQQQLAAHREPFFRLWGFIIGANASICLLFFLVSRLFDGEQPTAKPAISKPATPHETKPGQKFSGPRYFQPRPWSNSDPTPNIVTIESAKSQVNRIAKERKLGPGGAAKLTALIERLVEPAGPALRTEDADAKDIELSRLNLALDENESRLQE